MNEILIECLPGISGDMLLSAFYDFGVPKEIMEKPLFELGLEKSFSLIFQESKSCSFRGVKTNVRVIKDNQKRNWREIKNLIQKGRLERNLKKNIFQVFESLALAESKVHGIPSEHIHFHEVGAIDSLVDVIGVCASINYLNPSRIYCNAPTIGSGFIKSEHGQIPIPSPAVLELISKRNINIATDSFVNDELSTPTGIALILNFVDSFNLPSKFCVDSYGVGIGNKCFDFPNILRILEISSFENKEENRSNNPIYEEVCIQESLIDDCTPEDISSFVAILRKSGAFDVFYNPVNMKKDRIGFSITAIVPINKEQYFRKLWFQYSNTIGLRERRQGRWILPRRIGECHTSFGNIKFKETIKPNGDKLIKPENDEIRKLQNKYGKTTEEIRNILRETRGEFKPSKDLE